MGHTPIKRLSNLTFGVVGLGRIGKASARKATGLGMSVIAYDPYIPQGDFDNAYAVSADFDTVMSTADIVSLHVPLNAETRGMIDARALSLMKPTAFLVNTARGPVVDVPALVAAVQAEQIAGAGIDVLPIEPCPVDDPVLHEPRIIVTPHLAASSVEAVHDVRIRGAEEAFRVLTGHAPKYPVNQPADPRNACVLGVVKDLRVLSCFESESNPDILPRLKPGAHKAKILRICSSGARTNLEEVLYE